MGCQSEVVLGKNLTFTVCTHDPDTGVLTDADAVPPYRVYEDETGTAISNGNMAKLDDANTTGFYSEQLPCTAGNGYEIDKSYTLYIEATVDSDKGGISYGFTVRGAHASVLASGTTDSGSTTTFVDAALTQANDYWNGSWVLFTSGNAANQIRLITDFDAGTDTVTFAPATTSAIGTDTYEIIPAAGVSSVSGAVGSVAGAVASVSGNVDGNVSGSVASVAGNVGGSTASVSGAVGSVAGNVDGSVGSVAGNVDGSAASVVGAVGSVAGNVDGSVASVVGAVGSVAGNVDGSAGSVAGNVDGSVGSVAGAVGSVAGNVDGSVASVVGAVGSVAGNVDGSVGSVTGAVGSVTGAVGSVSGNVDGNVTGSVGDLAAAAVNKIWDDLTSGITQAGSIGKLLVDNVNATIGSRSSHTAAAVWAVGTRTLTSFGTLVADIWANATRTLTALGAGAVSSIWAAGTRTLTALGANTIDSTSVAVSGATEIANAVDVVITAAHGSGSYQASGGGSGANTVTITVKDGGAVPISGVEVHVSPDAGTSWTYSDTTGATGVAIFHLDDATYLAQCSKSGYTHTAENVVVSGTTTQTLTIAAFSPSTPSANQCTVYGWVYDESGAAIASRTVRVSLITKPQSSSGVWYDKAASNPVTSAAGLFELVLAQGIEVRVYSVDSSGNADGAVDRKITVPAESSVLLDDADIAN